MHARIRRLTKPAATLAVLFLLAATVAGTVAAEESPLVREDLALDGPTDAPPAAVPGGGTRVAGAMVGLGDGSVLYFGGMTLSGVPLGDTWLWRDGAWSPRCGTALPGSDAPCGPSARGFHTMSGSGGAALLYGGTTDFEFDTVVGDTWRWDGTWQPVCGTSGPACAPGPRLGSSLFDIGGTSYLFGGVTTSGVQNDTWAFDGSSWTRVHDGSGTAPMARTMGAMTTLGDRGVLFGGQSFGDDKAGETTHVTTAAPLRSEIPAYLMSNAPLSYGGIDFISAGFGGSLAAGTAVLSAGEWYQATDADDTTIALNTRRATGYDVALLVADTAPNPPTTLYIESGLLPSVGLTRDCAGVASFVAGFGDTNPGPQTCHNYGRDVLTQSAPGASFTFNGLGGFDNPGPVTVVGGFSDPAIAVNGTRIDDNQGPCCGQSDPGNFFFYGPGGGEGWVSGDDTTVPVDGPSGLSAVHAAVFSINGADLTLYVLQSLLDSEGAAASCEGIEQILQSFGPDAPQPLACRNFVANVFSPNGPDEDFTFNGFGGAQYPGTLKLTPDFAGTTPYLRVSGSVSADSSGDVPADTWIFDPTAADWTPICGTEISGATAPCGPGPTLVGSMAAVGSTRLLMAGGVQPSEDDLGWPGAVWEFDGANWSSTTLGWPSTVEGSAKAGDVPPGLRLAATEAGCVIGYGNAPGTGDGVTVGFGVDADGDGSPEVCVAGETTTPEPPKPPAPPQPPTPPDPPAPPTNLAGTPGWGSFGSPTPIPGSLAATGPTGIGLAAPALGALLIGLGLTVIGRRLREPALAAVPPHGRARPWR